MVINALRLAKLFVLQLLDVAERFHARRVAIDVAATNAPSWNQCGESAESALAQELALVAADLEVARFIRHVLAVLLGRVSIRARFNCVDDGYPLVKTAAIKQVPHRVRAVLVTEFRHDLGYSLLKFTVESGYSTLIIGCDSVFTSRDWVMMYDIVEVGQDNRNCRTKCSKFFIHRVQGAVSIRPLEYQLHSSCDIV